MRKKHDIFDSEDYGQAAAKDALAKLFRGFLIDLGIRPITWTKLLTRYVLNPLNGVPRDKRTIVRGNLPKALEKDKITCDSFMRGLRVLEVDKADVYVVIHRGNKRTLKKVRVVLGDVIENNMTISTDASDNVAPDADVDAYIERVARTGKK